RATDRELFAISLQAASVQGIAKLGYEIIHFLLVPLMLLAPLFFAQFKRSCADPLDRQPRALDHDPPVVIAEPFQVQALPPSVRRSLAGMQPFGEFTNRDFEML